MGNKCTKPQSVSLPNVDLPSEEIEYLRKAYRMTRRRSSLRLGTHPEKDNLTVSWKHHADKDLIALYSSYLHKGEGEITFEIYCNLFYKLAKIPCNEIAVFIMELFELNDEAVSYNTVLMYVKNVISSYFMILIAMKDEVTREWMKYEFLNPEATHVLFAESLCQELKRGNVQEHFARWYNRCPYFQKIHSTYVHKLFHVPGKQVTYGHQTIEKHLLPILSGTETFHKGESFSVLCLAEILFLNLSLPEEKQFEWRLCFSTAVHGLAFGKMVRLIIDKGPNIIIVKDKTGHKFGGYASSTWKIAPNFQGNEESFLFSLHPAMQIYESTSYNKHYQYLNYQQQTLPNGLGMGGQFDYFGFWLDADFGKGHCSETCTTYKHYKMLSGDKFFDIDHVEIWAVVNIKEDSDGEEELPSILDKDTSAKALLEIAGRQMASDGYREKDN